MHEFDPREYLSDNAYLLLNDADRKKIYLYFFFEGLVLRYAFGFLSAFCLRNDGALCLCDSCVGGPGCSIGYRGASAQQHRQGVDGGYR